MTKASFKKKVRMVWYWISSILDIGLLICIVLLFFSKYHPENIGFIEVALMAIVLKVWKFEIPSEQEMRHNLNTISKKQLRN